MRGIGTGGALQAVGSWNSLQGCDHRAVKLEEIRQKRQKRPPRATGGVISWDDSPVLSDQEDITGGGYVDIIYRKVMSGSDMRGGSAEGSIWLDCNPANKQQTLSTGSFSGAYVSGSFRHNIMFSACKFVFCSISSFWAVVHASLLADRVERRDLCFPSKFLKGCHSGFALEGGLFWIRVEDRCNFFSYFPLECPAWPIFLLGGMCSNLFRAWVDEAEVARGGMQLTSAHRWAFENLDGFIWWLRFWLTEVLIKL